jgi:sulfite reductase alpha subunit-like flavoprotein
MSRLTLPPNAPFSGAQKMWLKGFLDGISSTIIPASGGTSAQPAAPAGLPVTILWGSQTGNSQGLGKKLSKSLAAKGHSPTLRDMAEVSPADLTAAENVLIITSTYGDGEPPDNAAALHAALHADDAPLLSSVNFAVLALGDSNYAEFCKCGHDFHNRLTALGAKPLIPIIEVDVDYDEPFANWTKQLEQALVA